MAAQSLVEMLSLTPSGPDSFIGHARNPGKSRIFGEAVVAQCLLAAYETVEGRLCHSLHCYFIHPGDPAEPIRFEVTRTRDGGAFATRHIAAIQSGKTILEMLASFQRPAAGYEHQMPLPGAIPPEQLVDDDPRGEYVGIQLRNVEVPRPGHDPVARPPRHQMWFRSERPLGTDIRHHQAALACASDFAQLPVIIQPHPVSWSTPGFQCTSLDHAIWFHRPLDFTQWHLCDMDTPSSSGERGLSRSTIYAQDGTLVATVTQEALIRMRRDTAPPQPAAKDTA